MSVGIFKRGQASPEDVEGGGKGAGPQSIGKGFSFGDQLRMAVSWRSTSNPAALASRDIPARLVTYPAIAQFVTKGKYGNELMRIDNFVNDLVDAEQEAVDSGEGIDGVPVSRLRKFTRKRRPTVEFARNVTLLQEVVRNAHLATEDMRCIMEDETPEEKVHLRISYLLGDVLWDDDIPNGLAARFSLMYSGGALFESFLYINDGTIYTTHLDYVDGGFELADLEDRPWPERGVIGADRFLALDEAWTRQAGFRLLSNSGDVVDERFWLNPEEVENFDERLAPEKAEGTDDPVMDSVSWRSLFVANYSGFEMLVGSFALLFFASIAWRSGAWWTIIPLALGLGCFGLMLYLLLKIVDSRLTVDRMVEKEKPDPEVWWMTQVTRTLLTVVSMCVMICGAAMFDIRVRGDEGDALTLASFVSLYPACAVAGVLVWILLGRGVRMPIRLNPISRELDRQRRMSDYVQSAILGVTLAFMVVVSDNAYDYRTLLAFTLAMAVVFPLIAYGVSRVWSLINPLRSVSKVTAPLYLHTDSGLSRRDWSKKYGIKV